MEQSNDSQFLIQHGESLTKAAHVFIEDYHKVSNQISYLSMLSSESNNLNAVISNFEQVAQLFKTIDADYSNILNLKQALENESQGLKKEQESLALTDFGDKNQNDKVKTRGNVKSFDILQKAIELKEKRAKERLARRTELQKLDPAKTISTVAVEPSIIVNLPDNKDTKEVCSPKTTSILVQFKGNVEQQIKSATGLPVAKAPDLDVKHQMEYLQTMLQFIETLPEQHTLLPQELYIFRNCLFYAVGIVSESLYQQSKDSLFTNHLRNYIFGYSQTLFPEIDYANVDAYIKTNNELLEMVKEMIHATLHPKIKSDFKSVLYMRIAKEKLTQNKDYRFYIQQMSKDEHTLFQLEKYKNDKGLLSTTPIILQTAIRFSISRLGKNAKNLKALNLPVFNNLNYFGNRLQKFIHKGAGYRHLKSLEEIFPKEPSLKQTAASL